jgi:hypothetical protein
MSRSSSGTTGGAAEVVKVLDSQAGACRCPVIWRSSSGMIGGAYVPAPFVVGMGEA